MKLGFDAKRLFHNTTGLGNYSRALLDGLQKSYPSNQYFLFDQKEDSQYYPNSEIVKPQITNFLWRSAFCIKQINALELDVFHGLSNQLPIGKWNLNTKKIVTIHDVIFKTHPEKYPLLDRISYDIKTSKAINIADKIIATSHFTAKDIMKHYELDSRKLEVVYQSCDDGFWQEKKESELNEFRNKHKLNQPFLLYVSSFTQRKNHLELINAFAKIDNKDVPLVLIGQKGEALESIIKLIKSLKLQNRVKILNNLKKNDLISAYQCANWFVYPSLIEGFGIPILEAMTSNLPILASDIEVFREVASPDVQFFDLKNNSELCSKLNNLLVINKLNYSSHLEKYKKEEISKQLMSIYKES